MTDTTSVVVTATEPARMSPATRFLRTLIQVLVPVAAVIPAAAALVGLSAKDTALVAGIMGAGTLIASAIMNGLNQASATRDRGDDRGQAPLMWLVYLVVFIVVIIVLFKVLDRV